MEEWKSIPEYPQYEASTLGNIRNALTKHVLKAYHVPNGYSQIRLSLGSKQAYKVCRVHRLVAQTWIPNADSLRTTVNHKNRDKTDNSVCNLEWLSHKEQSEHCVRTLDCSYKRFNDVQENVPEEIWRIIEKAPTYSVSNMGRIKLNKLNRVLRGHTKGVYDQVKLPVTGTHHYTTTFVHKLVAEAFISDYDSNLVVNHKDGNKKNNCVDNLECITQSDNIRHTYELGMNRRQVPIKQFSLTNDFIEEHRSFTSAARVTGLNEAAIRWGVNNRRPHGGFLWYRSDTYSQMQK